jgi:outer membrane protein assembly factor BamA
VILLLTLAGGAASVAFAQGNPPRWIAYADGERLAAPDSVVATPDEAARLALTALHERGYLAAAIDSAVVDQGTAVLYASRGAVTLVDQLHIQGVTAVDVDVLRGALQTRSGSPFTAAGLSSDIGRILSALERSGRPMARAEVSSIELDGTRAEITITVHEGSAHVLRGIEFLPDARTDPEFAARLAGLRPGAPLQRYDPAAIRRELEYTGLFASIGEAELIIDAEGQAVIRIPVEEAQPGAVDLVMGYLPPASTGGSGSLIGSGSLVLRNLFGRGRRLSFELIRNPGLVSEVDFRVADPYLFGVPLRLEARFSGYQSDSTFSRQLFGMESGYRLAPGLEVFAAASRESVEAGIAGAKIVDGRQRVSSSGALFGGIGARFFRVDRPLNPRTGILIESLLEQGVRRRTLPPGSEEAVAVRQQRLHAGARVFIPTFSRQTVVIGGNAAVLLGEVYDDSDLFRFGGATTMRGYEEDQFRGNMVGRATLEYRYLLDPTSFAFAFADLGYVHRPETPGAGRSENVLTGYGLGLQYRTPLGLATATYALNPDDGLTRGKVHVGLSIAL